jgi:hypothetical protein
VGAIMTDSGSSNESKRTSEDVWKISTGDAVSQDIGPDNYYMDKKLKRQLDAHYAVKQASIFGTDRKILLSIHSLLE